jgi:lipoprotein-anchoring transpeptidase ErfK/SrfK
MITANSFIINVVRGGFLVAFPSSDSGEASMAHGTQVQPKVSRNAAILSAVMIVFASICWGQSDSETVWKPVPRRRILVSIPDRKLAVMEGAKAIRIFRIAVGASASPTPVGSFEIETAVSDPTYFHSGLVIPPGTDNPVGTRWMGLNQKGYGIHGTNDPQSIGKAASHGCIRLRNQDVEQLFEMVRVRDAVEIHAERDARIVTIFGTEILPEKRTPGNEAGGQY